MNNRFAQITTTLVLAVAVVAGCSVRPAAKPDAPGETTIFQEEKPTMDLAMLPTLKQTRDQMLELLFAVQAEVTRQVPASAPWKWYHDYLTTACQNGAGLSLGFPGLVSKYALTDEEWSRVLPAVVTLAGAAGLTNVGSAGNNTSGNHDARISSDDGRELSFGARDATAINATISCRRTDDSDLWVDGRIPMPPDPQP